MNRLTEAAVRHLTRDWPQPSRRMTCPRLQMLERWTAEGRARMVPLVWALIGEAERRQGQHRGMGRSFYERDDTDNFLLYVENQG